MYVQNQTQELIHRSSLLRLNQPVSLVHRDWLRPLVWITLATSSLVLIEPAPYDLLVCILIFAVFSTGLIVPRSLGAGLLLLALFIIGNLFGSLFGGHDAASLRSLAIRIYMVLSWIFFASLIAQSPGQTMRTIWSGYTFAAVVAVFWGAGQYFDWLPGQFTGAEHRATAGFKDANVFGPFLVPVALVSVAKLFCEVTLRRRLLHLMIFLILTFGVLLAFSRGAWINFIASGTCLCLLLAMSAVSRQRKLEFVLMLFGLAMLSFLALFLAVSFTSVGDMFAERASLVQAYDIAAGGRFATQFQAIRTIGENPAGIGAGMSALVLGLEPHNIYLHVTLEAGWLGGLSMCLFLLLTLHRGIRSAGVAMRKLDINILIALAALFGTLLQSIFIDSTHWRHMWLLLAIIWGVTVIPSMNTNKTE